VNLLTAATLTTVYVEPNPHSAYHLQWNFNVQQQITQGLSLTVGYVGSKGVHEPLSILDTNMVPPFLTTRTANGHLAFPVGAPVINPNFGEIYGVEWGGWSKYNSLQINVTEKMRHGLSFQGVYEWSKSMDVGSLEFGSTELPNSMDNPYPFNLNLNRGLSDFNHAYHLSINLLWDAPAPRTQMMLPRFLLSGWEMGGIFTYTSGSPFSVALSSDRAGTGVTTAATQSAGQRPDFNPGPGCSSPNAVNTHDVNNYIKLSCFSFPAANTLGNLGRNTLVGPSLQNLDFSLFKNHILYGERLKVQFRAEVFNLFNRANLGSNFERIFSSGGQPVPSNAALISPTVTTSRQIQFGMKFVY
jgi:hypothetical protein